MRGPDSMPVLNRSRMLSGNQVFCVCFAAMLLICAAAAVYCSRHWPLAGDAALMHYVVFLMRHGFIPYKDIADVNLPGSYLADTFAMHVFEGALGWRIYDLLVTILLTTAAVFITRKKEIFAGIFAGLFFLLMHLQDGIAQAGQRDLVVAALLIWAYALLFRAQNRPFYGLPAFVFGFFLGVSGLIKPFFLPLGAVLLLLSAQRARKCGVHPVWHLGLGFLGLSLPPAGATIWLCRHGALSAFVHTLRGLIPLHASLGHRPIAYLLTHCVAPILPLCLLWIVVWILLRKPFDLERAELLLGAIVALLAYVAQGKGYPYHRYPLMALLLLMMGIDFSAGLERKGWVRCFSVVALAAACFFYAPRAAWLVHSFDPAMPFEQNLAHDLRRYGNLSENVQCLDTFGGCINTLYNLRAVQSTGFLYDCYLYVPGEAAEEYRRAFWTAYQKARPEIVVLTSQYCFSRDSFQKIDAWPQLRNDLSDSYQVVTEWHATQPQHWWSRREFPSQYRIYLRKH